MSKRLIIIIISLIVVLLLAAVLLIFVILKKPPAPPPANANQNVNTNWGGILPAGDGDGGAGQGPGDGQDGKPLEKRLFSDYWQPIPLTVSAQVPRYDLPFNIKVDVTNYRDFSRKIDLDRVSAQLENNGLVVITNPFETNEGNMEDVYQTLREKEIPIIVTTDSVLHFYRLHLQSVFKEIEKDIFYDSIWQVSDMLFASARERFEQRYKSGRLEDDLLKEANRMEMAYAAVALELLKPKPEQIKAGTAGITTDLKFFTEAEATKYQFTLPDYLKDQVEKEVNLILQHKQKSAKSSVFLYYDDYSQFEIPQEYQTSEKLKNYWLAAKWYETKLFPLKEKTDSCPDCLLDKEDLKIALVAASYIAQDFADNQLLKNTWLRVYKTISYFKGLRHELTYLHYIDALTQLFGDNFNVDEIFGDSETLEENIFQLKTKLAEYEFLGIEGGFVSDSWLEPPFSADDLDLVLTANKGMKLLREGYLADLYLFDKLTYPEVSLHQEITGEPGEVLPFTACKTKENEVVRCLPQGLDVINLLGLTKAKSILSQEKNLQYNNYTNNFNRLKDELSLFDQHTWLKNYYWSILNALQYLLKEPGAGFPTFMQNELWQNKQLNTALSAWTEIRRDTTLQVEKNPPAESPGVEIIWYGYVEPLPEFYNQLLTTDRMLRDGLLNLNIADSGLPAIKRLYQLDDILNQLTEISLKELANQDLDWHDYNFINNFDKKIQTVLGQIDKKSKEVNLDKNVFQQVSDDFFRDSTLKESLGNVNLIIVAYTTPGGKIILGAGPAFSYYEAKDRQSKELSDWQKEYIVE